MNALSNLNRGGLDLCDTTDPMLLRLRSRIADYRGRGVYAGYPNAHRCIFIHVPKTAGTSIARALFATESRHVPYFEYERANPRKFLTYFKFAFVRNPWDRLVSIYFFLQRGGMNETDRVWAEKNIVPFARFSDFVREWLTPESAMTFPHLRPQCFYVADRDSRLMVDFVGRYERLNEDFAHVASRLRSEAVLSISNKGEHEHYTAYYDNETREIVGNVYERDIDTFGYVFGG